MSTVAFCNFLIIENDFARDTLVSLGNLKAMRERNGIAHAIEIKQTITT